MQRRTVKDSEVFWTKEEAQEFCIDYMNKSAGYKQCLGVPNINPDYAIADCVADIQVNVFFLKNVFLFAVVNAKITMDKLIFIHFILFIFST